MQNNFKKIDINIIPKNLKEQFLEASNILKKEPEHNTDFISTSFLPKDAFTQIIEKMNHEITDDNKREIYEYMNNHVTIRQFFGQLQESSPKLYQQVCKGEPEEIIKNINDIADKIQSKKQNLR